MARPTLFALLLIALVQVNAFVGQSTLYLLRNVQGDLLNLNSLETLVVCFIVPTLTTRGSMSLYASDNDNSLPNLPRFVERGVSVDQDGKSNVWAIEPKVEVSTKSSEENTQSAVIAAGGLGVFAVFAVLVLSNLPDPNQF